MHQGLHGLNCAGPKEETSTKKIIFLRNSHENTMKYYTLRFYFPYLSLLAQPVTIFIYGPAR
jgi:hypothetical protein